MTIFIEYRKRSLTDWEAAVDDGKQTFACTKNYRYGDGSMPGYNILIIEDLKGTRAEVLAKLKQLYPDARCREMYPPLGVPLEDTE